jgi:DNA-binding NarL/FixJ family response regulator
VRILIADDQKHSRQSLRTLLQTLPAVEEVRDVPDGKAAIELLATWEPDVAVLDARMPELDGVQATRIIRATWPRVRVIVLSMYPDYQADALRAGAHAFVSKGAPPSDLLDLLCEKSQP